MILFRCPSCSRQFSTGEARIGNLLNCSCGQHLKVPRRSGGPAKYRPWGVLFIELVVYGGGGGVLGFLLGVLIVSQVGIVLGRRRWIVMFGLGLVGFLIGVLGGERGIEWIGRKIRDREQK